MIGLLVAFAGAVLGYLRAGRLGGNRMDRLQYAAVFAIVGFLLGMAVTIMLDWQGIV